MTSLTTMTPQDRAQFLAAFALSEERATGVLQTARSLSAEAGEVLPLTRGTIVLLSGRATCGAQHLDGPALIPAPQPPRQNAHWTAGGAIRALCLDPAAFSALIVEAVADGLDLPGFEPAMSERRALRAAVTRGRILAGLSRPLDLALQTAMTLHHVEGGAPVLTAGDAADALYVVVTGRLTVTRRDADGTIHKLAEIRPGGVVGEIGLLVNIARTADVSAIRDGLLARLTREDFERLLIAHPIELTRVFAHAIYDNLEGTRRAPAQVVATTIVLVPGGPTDQSEHSAQALRDGFRTFGRCELIRASDFRYGNQDHHAVLARLSRLEREVDTILLLADDCRSDWTRLAARQADRLVFLAGAEPIADPEAFKSDLLLGDPSTFPDHCIVRLNPAKAQTPAPVLQHGGPPPGEIRTYSVRNGNRADFERVARFIGGRAVGLVLGGGAARGLAHIGVLRAMEELTMPVDIIGGNSMGALIAAQYAFGTPCDDLISATRRLFTKGERPAFPAVSLLSGHGMERGLTELFGDTRIEELWRPFFAVACSISKARVVTLDRGPLWRAVRASNSPAGLLPPVPHDGELLIDGAVLNNVPTDVMRGLVGEGTVIGVAVDKSDELMVAPELTRLTTRGALSAHGMPDHKRTPRITEILRRAGSVGGVAARERVRPLADIWLEPPVYDFSMISYHRATELADIGYRYALKALADE
ncbi:cyclic nucleotide-binding and patatin-like phospholipase domain-containing protein [Pseudodonghicola flavimaris]|uniref:Cyclic nucleotide-binding and patatin-like phospholipase domain-containing protein n=1 Tax=Pseudodonghicola flavimaris TaxID=3050036 RepID=A0ABT7F1U8_9RHOB|nr:cyclic nucleotide-binding and patatin-like phospholipase domain-containing protein [Pseudodonghicola flavimaris]MDK3018567.1 cyclic nucleotide-binding and patatin-like phospholipase domain-containing protein [Pseudodonghicola flavimaris]